MKQVSQQSVTDLDDSSVFMVRYHRILHHVFQDHSRDAVNLISDTITESTEPDELLMLYRAWIDVLIKQKVTFYTEDPLQLGEITKQSVINPSLEHLCDHLKQLADCYAEVQESSTDQLYYQSFLALAALACCHLGRLNDVTDLIESVSGWHRSPYAEELDWLLYDQNHQRIHFGDDTQSCFRSTLSYFLDLSSHDLSLPEGAFCDYSVMRSVVEYGRSSQNHQHADQLLNLIDEIFGFTLARGLWDLEQATSHQDQFAMKQVMSKITTYFDQNHELISLFKLIDSSNESSDDIDTTQNLSDQLASHCRQLDLALDRHDQEASFMSYQKACESYIASLADKNLDVPCPADQKMEQKLAQAWHKIVTGYHLGSDESMDQPEDTAHGAWLCFLSDRRYEMNFLQHRSHKNLLVSMENKAAVHDVVFVVKNVHQGVRLLGIYEVYFAAKSMKDTHANKVLKPVMIFDQQGYPTIKLPTCAIDSSETTEVKRRFGLEDALALTAESLGVVLYEIKRQTGVSSESIDILDRSWKHLA